MGKEKEKEKEQNKDGVDFPIPIQQPTPRSSVIQNAMRR